MVFHGFPFMRGVEKGKGTFTPRLVMILQRVPYTVSRKMLNTQRAVFRLFAVYRLFTLLDEQQCVQKRRLTKNVCVASGKRFHFQNRTAVYQLAAQNVIISENNSVCPVTYVHKHLFSIHGTYKLPSPFCGSIIDSKDS